MIFKEIPPGRSVPDEINVVIEIPSNSGNVKYEVDKEFGTVNVDRFLGTSMVYPCEYGFVPKTLSEDGDPVDVLVLAPTSLVPGAVIRCRPVGLLRMTDESGKDAKILSVPISKLSPRYDHIKAIKDIDPAIIASIEHFFTHYKDLDKGKWVKVDGWEDIEAARKEIMDSIKRYEAN